MPTITITITDTEMAVLKTHLTDPEAWAEVAVKNKIRKCADRVYEASTGQVARQRKIDEKIAVLETLDLKPRGVEDKRPALKHQKKEIKNEKQ